MNRLLDRKRKKRKHDFFSIYFYSVGLYICIKLSFGRIMGRKPHSAKD